MKTTAARWTLSLLASGALSVLAPGCGDDSSDSASLTDAGTEAEGGVSQDEATEDDATQDEATEDETTQDEATEDEATQDEATEDDATQDEASQDETEPVDEQEAGAGDDSTTVEAGTEPEPGEGGAPPASGEIDELIAAICDWEYRCCDEGELAFRMGPTRTTAEACTEFFVYQLRESNSQENDFVAGSALGLLGQLAFSVNLNRVDLNPDGIAECTAQYLAMGCSEHAEPALHCGGPVDFAASDVCALSNLFEPILTEGDECTPALTETLAGNDIECVAGSTCLPADHPENPSDDPSCVSRSLDGEPCNDDDDCDFNFYCGADGACAEKGDAGDPCSFDDPELPAPGAEDAACKLGLSCHPIELVCVDNCSTGYTCSADSQCPDGQSCVPLTVNDDSTSFRVCQELGSSAAARCDSDADCVETRYCDGSGVCSADADENEECSVNGQCPEGTYCNVTCTPFTLRGNPCARDEAFASPECEPAAVGCIYDETDARLECSSSKREAGEECAADFDCSSSLCEYAADTATVATCVDGAGQGDSCDVDTATGVALRCRPGFVCLEGICADQLPPGGDCEAAGLADATLCANATCLEQWDGFMCTDAPTAESAGGTGLTCDGN